MRILSRYIMCSYLSAFLLTGMVLTFVLSVGFLFKVITFLMQGASFAVLGRYLLASVPEVLGFTIPLSLLISALLVFGRMSSDSEISAMRACGVSFRQIMFWPLVLATFCTLLGFFIQNEVMPRGHYVRRTISNRLALDLGVHILEPGRFINEIDDFSVYCGRKDENTLFDVHAIDSRDDFVREIQAEKAVISAEGNDLILHLEGVRITPMAKDVTGTATMDSFVYRCEGAFGRKKKYNRKIKDFYFSEIVDLIDELKKPNPDLSDSARALELCKARFVFHNRCVWALSAFCFVLIGIPLGIQGQRKDSSKGMGFSLVVGISFFLFLLLAESLSDKPDAYPYVLVWIPVVISIGAAMYMIPKNQ